MISLTLTWKGQKPDKLRKAYANEEQLRLMLSTVLEEVVKMTRAEDCDIRIQVERERE